METIENFKTHEKISNAIYILIHFLRLRQYLIKVSITKTVSRRNRKTYKISNH